MWTWSVQAQAPAGDGASLRSIPVDQALIGIDCGCWEDPGTGQCVAYSCSCDDPFSCFALFTGCFLTGGEFGDGWVGPECTWSSAGGASFAGAQPPLRGDGRAPEPPWGSTLGEVYAAARVASDLKATEAQPGGLQIDGQAMTVVDVPPSAAPDHTVILLLLQGCTCISPHCVAMLCPADVNASLDTGGKLTSQGQRPDACGGRLGNTCNTDEYCAYRAGVASCGFADATSVCLPRPSRCGSEHEPVCGCDGETYPNGCDAARHGQGVLHAGSCVEQVKPQSFVLEGNASLDHGPWQIDPILLGGCIPNCLCVTAKGCPCCQEIDLD